MTIEPFNQNVFDDYSSVDKMMQRLKAIAKYHSRRVESGDPFPGAEKLTGSSLMPGATLVLEWGSHGISDQAYLMVMPSDITSMFMEETLDFCLSSGLVHIPMPTREAKSDPDSAKWITLSDLLENPQLTKVHVDCSSITKAMMKVTP